MWDSWTIILVFVAFWVAGLVKGVVGFGLPTIALALITALVGLQTAMALVLVPAFATNVWQGFAGGSPVQILRRFWLLFLAAVAGTWLGTLFLTWLDARLAAAFVGIIIMTYAGWSLRGLRLPNPGGRDRWLAPIIGVVNGIISGMTGTFVVPAVPYMQAVGLSPDRLVQAMGILFTILTIALALSLGDQGRLTPEDGLASVLALAPALIGMRVGQTVRVHLPATRFRHLMFIALGALGCFLSADALVSLA